MEKGYGQGESGERKRPYPGTSLGSSGGKPLLHGPDKNSSAKEQQRRRDATKIYLLRSYVNWQMEKELYKHVHDLTSVSNADFAEHLLQDHTKRFQMHLFRKDAESQTEAFSAAVTTERSVDTQKGEDTPDPVTSTPLKKPSANVLSNVTSRIRYGAAWERNLRLYEYTLPHLHDPEQKRSYIWQGQALFPDFC
ncbi:uncharacterized protein [Apostichopus japonicus]|uniref:uncharacterized protein isoform X1 n=1 Tax=Stichopus japonicus TaxID=307972 RepID=UPI003AB1B480